MRRSERRGHGGAPGKAALEEAAPAEEAQPLQPNGAPLLRGEGLPGDGAGGPRAVAAAAAPAAPLSAVTQGDRRSTESEVYDDGTNTFFW